MSNKVGKIIKTISIDCKPELVQHIEKQANFSNYVQTLIEQDMTRLQTTEKQQNNEPKIILTKTEHSVYTVCIKYFREHGGLKYGRYYEYFPIQADADFLRCMLTDVYDTVKGSKELGEFVKHIQENDDDYTAYYEKMCHNWLQENPIPDEWKKEIIPGMTLHNALQNILPEALNLKYKKLPITIKRISEVVGLTYQQTYTQLMTHIRPILKELQVEV
jgi:hypothetical protein